MKISEVIKLTGLTRKSILYYEEQQLINPSINNNNNYRDYSQKDIDRLIKISILRQMDVPVNQIKDILENPYKMKVILESHLNKLQQSIEKIERTAGILKTCLSDFDSSSNTSKLTNQLLLLKDCLQMDAKGRKGFIKKEIQRIFPGSLGKAFFLQYGAFLNEPVDTVEKNTAWVSLVKYLDKLEEIDDLNDSLFPEEFVKIYSNLPHDKLDQIENTIFSSLKQIVSFTDKEFQEYKSKIYESLCNSTNMTEIKLNTDQYSIIDSKIKEKLKSIGFYYNVEKYIKILCPDYQRYLERIQSIEKYITEKLSS
ncbi:UNVERIFIED_CONTAM: DNA-binding transcriptional MerR regulator [Acetivibrio alkalicellulosi]